MGKLGCLLGVLLMGLSVVALFGFIVIPVLPGADSNTTVSNTLGALVCGSGETYVQDRQNHSDFRGSGVTVTSYCEAPNGTRTDVTMKMVTLGGVGFLVPFLVGLLLSIGSFAWMAARKTRSLVAGQSALFSTQDTGPESGTMQIGGIPIHFTRASAAQPGTSPLAEKLQQLQDLLSRNLITQEEYDRARRQILDEGF